MAKRIYLIPFETDKAARQGMDAAPKYFALFGPGSHAIIPKETTTGATRTWLHDYFLVSVVSNDFTALEANTDVIRLDDNFTAAKLVKIGGVGISTTGLSVSSDRSEVEQRILSWLTEKNKTFSEVGLASGV